MGPHQPFIPVTYLGKSLRPFDGEGSLVIRTYINWFISEDDILEDNPEAIIHEFAQSEIRESLCFTGLCQETDQASNINYNTQQMEEVFMEELIRQFSLRTYHGSIGSYSLIVNGVYLIRAVVLPENFYYQRLHLWARGTIDMSKVVILVDSSLEDPQLALKGLRKLYIGRLDPILKDCGADVWIVPPGFIGEYTTIPKIKLPSDIQEFVCAVNGILETARSFIGTSLPPVVIADDDVDDDNGHIEPTENESSEGTFTLIEEETVEVIGELLQELEEVREQRAPEYPISYEAQPPGVGRHTISIEEFRY